MHRKQDHTRRSSTDIRSADDTTVNPKCPSPTALPCRSPLSSTPPSTPQFASTSSSTPHSPPPPPPPSSLTPQSTISIESKQPNRISESRPTTIGNNNTVQSTTPRTASTSSASASASSSHQQYLDSLQLPSAEDFARLCRVQEERERNHRRRNHDLRRQYRITRRKSMEARRDFMVSKVLREEKGKVKWMETGRENGESNEAKQDRHHSGSGGKSVGDGANGNEVKGKRGNEDPESLETKAARVIQRSYRGYRVRREMQGLGIDASTRWTHAIRDAQWEELTKPRARGTAVNGIDVDGATRSNARRNWIKVATIARRAGGDEDSVHSTSDSVSSISSLSSGEAGTNPEELDAARAKKRKAQAKRREHARIMGLQYFLELVDLKHRYGSNLRTYHEAWKRSDTHENFFYWLDYGEGTGLELASCPRERLDRERVRYLNREERQHYLVNVDAEGRLVWAKNGIRIDTTAEWKDSMRGIVPLNDPTPAFSPEIEAHARDQSRRRDSSSSRSRDQDQDHNRESELEAARAAKYTNTDLDDAKGVRKIKHHVSASTVMNKLLRKSVRKNTWIFVADTSFRLYVGIKASGAFQHSSFLSGSRISAAGLIKVKSGRLSSLSPLSGHYRPPASNFRAFVRSLEEEGADMSHVSVSRSYAILVGLEAYVATRRKARDAFRAVRQRKTAVLRPEVARRAAEDAYDKSQSAARERKVLEREREDQERRREENKVSVRLLQKLGWRPRGPNAQENGHATATAATTTDVSEKNGNDDG